MNIHSLQLETILMSINRWIIDKLGYVHIMECRSAVKKNELYMIHTQTCPNLKIAKLSESKQRIHLSRIPFIQTKGNYSARRQISGCSELGTSGQGLQMMKRKFFECLICLCVDCSGSFFFFLYVYLFIFKYKYIYFDWRLIYLNKAVKIYQVNFPISLIIFLNILHNILPYI